MSNNQKTNFLDKQLELKKKDKLQKDFLVKNVQNFMKFYLKMKKEIKLFSIVQDIVQIVKLFKKNYY